MRVAINPDHIISGKNTAEIVKKNDHRKCNCRSVLKYVKRVFDNFFKPRTKIPKSFFTYFFKCLFINLINFLADCSAALSFRPTMAPHGNSHSFLYTSQFLSEEKSQPL